MGDRDSASGGGCCLKDSFGEAGGLVLFLSDSLGESIGEERGRAVDEALCISVPPFPLDSDS